MTKIKNWIQKHPIWTGIIGLFLFIMVLGIFLPEKSINEESSTTTSKSLSVGDEGRQYVEDFSPTKLNNENPNVDLSEGPTKN